MKIKVAHFKRTKMNYVLHESLHQKKRIEFLKQKKNDPIWKHENTEWCKKHRKGQASK